MSSETKGNTEDLFAEASKAVDVLYDIRDTYFPTNPDDKISKLITESNLTLQVLDQIPQEKRKTPGQRATYEYLRGKILDVSPEYKKEAEDHLSKAVKLNPSLADAWLSLGNCIWKKGDLVSAKNCFTLGLSKGLHKGLLCQLSMLERRMAQGSEDQVKIVDDSIKHAKEAIALDVKDGNSWYNLGNAYLTSFFVTGAWDHGKLLQSLKSYQHAEKDERMTSNPDLYYNCAIVNKYLENYERALSGFEAAALRDPGLNAMEEVQRIVRLLDKIESLLRGQTKVKRLASLASSITSVNLNASYRRETIDCLLEGLNKAVAIVGRVLFFVKHENVAPLLKKEIKSLFWNLLTIILIFPGRESCISSDRSVLISWSKCLSMGKPCRLSILFKHQSTLKTRHESTLGSCLYIRNSLVNEEGIIQFDPKKKRRNTTKKIQRSGGKYVV